MAIATSTNPEKVGFSAGTVLTGHKTKRSCKVSTASELCAVADFRGKHTRSDWPDPRNAHQSLPRVVISKLQCEFAIDLTDLLLQILEVLM
jgi:hypothetical protein